MYHNPGPRMHSSEVRRHRRFVLQFPVFLSVSAGKVAREYEGVSKNVSVGGMLIKTSQQLPLHANVTLTMQLSGRKSGRAIRLSADAEVVRVQPLPLEGKYAVGVKYHGPIADIRAHLGRLGQV